jgi:hypothetical protein
MIIFYSTSSHGICCRCEKHPATLISPSGTSAYCAPCGTSRCGKHTIAEFVRDEDGRYVDPCVVAFRHAQELRQVVKQVSQQCWREIA